MTNENKLTIPTLQSGAISKHTDETFNKLAKSSDYLARIQLYGGNSEAVKKRQIPMAHYGLATDKEHITDLGEEFHCVPLAWRPKAMMISDESNPINYFDPSLPEFQKIVEQSDVEDSGCMFGVEFLIWLIKEKQFTTFFFNSKTMRREAPNVRPLIGKHVLFKIKLIETRKYSWHGPVTIEDTSPIANAPNPEELTKELDRFLNPPVSVVTQAEPKAAEAQGKRAR
jgi:hypothetical protein